MSNRIANRFAKCTEEGRPALVTFVTAGDPDLETSQKIIDGFKEGRDIDLAKELGVVCQEHYL